MKKILYFAIAAAVVMACSKTEEVYTPSEEISFMPVSQIESKAAVESTNYTASQNFYVFAHTTENQAYFSKVSFQPSSESTAGGLKIYTGSPAQYWPNVKALKFAGYTESGNTATATHTLAADFTSLAVTGYVQPSPTTADAKNDLMYFFNDNGGAGYAKGTEVISPVMKHACAWLTIKVKADTKLVDDADDTKSYWKNLKVTNISLKNLKESGKVTFTPTAATWDFAGVTATASVDVLNAEKKITTAFAEFATVANNTIVLPQGATMMYVTYSYTTPAGATITEVKEINLATYTSTWDAGVHYTYDLTVTAEEIKIAPSSATWGTTGKDLV